jgi:hypothetical protein
MELSACLYITLHKYPACIYLELGWVRRVDNAIHLCAKQGVRLFFLFHDIAAVFRTTAEIRSVSEAVPTSCKHFTRCSGAGAFVVAAVANSNRRRPRLPDVSSLHFAHLAYLVTNQLAG